MKEITLGSLAQQGRDPLVTNNIQASSRPLTLECETSLPLQLPFSMPSPPTLLYSEPILSSYSQPSDFTHHSLHDTLAFQFEGYSSESYSISRSLLTESDYNPSLNLLSPEHNQYNAPLNFAPFSQSISPIRTASSTEQFPSYLQ